MKLRTSAPQIMPVDLHDPNVGLYLPMWYPADDVTGSTIKSYDINRHTATPTNTTWGYQGRITVGATADKIVVPAHSSLSLGNCHTLLLWIKVTTWTDFKYCWGKNVDGDNRIGYYTSNTDTMVFKVVQGAVSHVDLTIGSSILNNWTMLGHTANTAGNLITAYQDGVAGGTDATYTLPDTSAVDFVLGADGNGANQIAATILGECIILNRCATASEVKNIYDATKWRYR